MSSKKYFFYEGNKYESAQEMVGVLQLAGIVRKQETANNENQVSASLFIQKAYNYYKLPSYGQTAESLYLACAYTIKDYFLSREIYPSNLVAMKAIVYLTIEQCEDASFNGLSLLDAWEYAEKFYDVAYGPDAIGEPEFKRMMDAVAQFTHDFPKIEERRIIDKLQQLMANNSGGVFGAGIYTVNFAKQEGSTKLGNIDRKYSVKLW